MTKSWVKVDAALPMHPKLEALAEYFDGMGVPEALAQHVAYSVVVRMFSLAYKHYADGNLGGMTKRALAYQLEWTGGAAQLHDGLVSTGFLDVTEDGLIVHGFAEWSGKTDSREMAAVRQQDKRARDKIKTLEAQVKQLIDGTEKDVMSRNVTQRHASDSYQTPIRSDQIRQDSSESDAGAPAQGEEEVSTKLDAEPERKPERPKTQPKAQSKPCTGFNGKYADDCLRSKGRNRDGMWAVACGRCSREFEPPADLPKPKEPVGAAVKELLAGAGDAIRDKTQAAVSPGSMRELLGKVSEPLPEPNDPTADQEAAENERRATTQALIDARRNGATNEPL